MTANIADVRCARATSKSPVSGRSNWNKKSSTARLAAPRVLAQQAQKLRGAVMRAFSAAEMRQVIKTLIGEAVKGDVAAARLLLERALGPPIAWDMEERLSRVEAMLEEDDGHDN